MRSLGESQRLFDGDAAWSAVSRAYRSAGVSSSILGGLQLFVGACQPLINIRAPEPLGPAAGDVALFQPSDQSDPIGLAVFVDNGEVSVWSPADRRFHIVPVAALDGAGTTHESFLYAAKGSVAACRIAAGFWPHGRDDVTIPPGHIELVDPAAAARQIDWVEEHPRDPDQSLGHAIWRDVVGVVAWVSGVVGSLFTGLLHAGDWLLHHTWVFGAVALGVIGVLTTKFDATGLHHLLSYVLGGTAFLFFKALGMAASAFGLWRFARTMNSFAGGAIQFAGFMVTLATGLEGDGRSTVGGVGIAAASDLLFFAKPVGAGIKAAELAEPAATGLRGVEAGIAGRFGVATTLDRISDVIMVRPLAWTKTVAKFVGPQAAKWPAAGKIPERIADLASLVWRPGSMLNEAVDQMGTILKSLTGHSAEQAAASLEQLNRVLHAASGTQHVDQLANTGTLPTVQSPARLRPHQFLGRSDR